MASATSAPSMAVQPDGARKRRLRAALERTLAEVDADERVGPLIRATRLRMRFELTDAATALNVAAGDRDGHLSWSFADDPGWRPKLVLRMSSEVANRYLLGRESLAIALARGQVSCEGDSRAALIYLPATRLLAERYRRVVEADFPDLAA